MQKQTRPVTFHGSRYAERAPIGTAKSIKSTSPEAIRNFYQDWYRPELMSVVAGGDFEYTRRNRYQLNSMAEVLSIRLREKLREEMGGVYSVQANANASDRPDEEYVVSIVFSCAPDRADELAEAVFGEIEKMQSSPASDQNMQKVTEQQRRSHETSLKENSFWASQLEYYYSRDGSDPTAVLRRPDLIESLTAANLQQAAQQYLSREQFVRVTLLPEQGAGSDGATGDGG